MRYAIPLFIFIVVVGLLGYGLKLDPRLIPSPLIGKPVPEFTLPRLDSPEIQVSETEFEGQVWILNVWASWCVSCRAEHEFIMQLGASGMGRLIGLNYKDKQEDARAWLDELGDGYEFSLVDRDGKVAIDWGVYGVPETFIIGKDGLIKYKQIGPVNKEILEQEMLPLLKKLTS